MQKEFKLSEQLWIKILKNLYNDNNMVLNGNRVYLNNYTIKELNSKEKELSERLTDYFKRNENKIMLLTVINRKWSPSDEGKNAVLVNEFSQIMKDVDIYEYPDFFLRSLNMRTNLNNKANKLYKDIGVQVLNEMKKEGLVVEDFLNHCIEKLDLNKLNKPIFTINYFKWYQKEQKEIDTTKGIKLLKNFELNMKLKELDDHLGRVALLEKNKESMQYLVDLLKVSDGIAFFNKINKFAESYSPDLFIDYKENFNKNKVGVSTSESFIDSLIIDSVSLGKSKKMTQTQISNFLYGLKYGIKNYFKDNHSIQLLILDNDKKNEFNLLSLDKKSKEISKDFLEKLALNIPSITSSIDIDSPPGKMEKWFIEFFQTIDFHDQLQENLKTKERE